MCRMGQKNNYSNARTVSKSRKHKTCHSPSDVLPFDMVSNKISTSGVPQELVATGPRVNINDFDETPTWVGAKIGTQHGTLLNGKHD